MQAASPSQFDAAGAGGILLGVMLACIAVGALVGWAAGSVGIGAIVGAIVGIGMGSWSVYQRYKDAF